MSGHWLADVLAGHKPETIRFLSRADVAACLRDVDVVSVVKSALVDHHAGRTILPGEAYLSWQNDEGAYSRSIAMPGAIPPAGIFGMKIINASVSNPGLGIERAGGLGLCFDPQTARVRTCMEVGLLSAVRTAAVSAIAVETTGFPTPRELAVVGCGTQARLHLTLFLSRWPGTRQVTLYDRSRQVAEKLVEWCAARYPDVTVRIAEATAQAMAGADVVVFLTTASEGYVPLAWVRPGSILVNTSLGDLTDDVFVHCDRIYVDDVRLISENPRRPLGRLVNEDRVGVTATFGELLAGGHAADRPDSGYVVANPFGLGVLDVALFHAVAERAERSDAGANLSLYGSA